MRQPAPTVVANRRSALSVELRLSDRICSSYAQYGLDLSADDRAAREQYLLAR